MKHKGLLILGGAIIGEILLRCYGFCDAPLYRLSERYEYIPVSNQDGERFGRHYHINSFGQRSEEPDSSRIIILGLGDSVLWGGVFCDQDSLATTLFSNETSMQMLNISAGSWGPDNCAAYLKEYGTFGAQAIILLVSSHDAHDIMDFKPTVGVHESYPNTQYKFAWGELVCRYLIPRIEKAMNFNGVKELDPDQQVLAGIQKSGKGFNPGFNQVKQFADSVSIPMYMILHGELDELKDGQYNIQGQEIIHWADSAHVNLYKDIEWMKPSDYRDNIHLSNQGQRKLADTLKQMFLELLRK
jgi:hypothetical protein